MLNSTIKKHESSEVICYILSYYKSDGTLDNVLHHYEITSNAIAVFAVGQTHLKEMSFSSKSNLVEVLENGTIVELIWYNVTTTMTDNGKGTTDLFGVTLQRKAGVGSPVIGI
jgi:hypothetical protein